ncbi:hypothetical protein GU926_06000 [Nibribacter ruber]|uniref:TraB/GumN family protein n=1 Tax=Nibribacter ruber TaxID=2698458 RepID=A0A6P1NYW1_9BACT|nr:TraB/GumN family protein [Nibribacter ruber]QHL87011.1 hypothetical protein GU926_06000 [Nibribacter ruber]
MKPISILLSFLLSSLLLASCHSSDYYPLASTYNPKDAYIPFQEYSKYAQHPRPYVVASDHYVIFGASHTKNPQDPQIAQIEAKWNALQPTVALIEGKPGFTPPSFIDPVKELGENGKVLDLARTHNVPVYSWDLPKEELAKQLVSKFSAEQVALAQILNPYFGNLRFGKPESPEKYIEEFLERAEYVNQQENFKTVADVDRVWKKHFPTDKDWRETSDEYGLPGYLADLMAVSNDLRNQKMIAVMKELLAKNEKVFAISGSSHAVCVEPAFAKK